MGQRVICPSGMGAAGQWACIGEKKRRSRPERLSSLIAFANQLICPAEKNPSGTQANRMPSKNSHESDEDALTS